MVEFHSFQCNTEIYVLFIDVQLCTEIKIILFIQLQLKVFYSIKHRIESTNFNRNDVKQRIFVGFKPF